MKNTFGENEGAAKYFPKRAGVGIRTTLSGFYI